MQKKKVVIAGAGIMGASMGQIFASKGYTVVIYDLFPNTLAPAKKQVEQALDALAASKDITAEGKAETLANISFTSDINAFGDCDLVVECIIEDLAIKHKFYAQISKIVPDSAIVASNTSGLSITKIAEAVKNPERFAGMAKGPAALT